jgi:hypothetical protein
MRRESIDKATRLGIFALLVGQFTTLATFTFPYTKNIPALRRFLDHFYNAGGIMLAVIFMIAAISMVVSSVMFFVYVFKKDKPQGGNQHGCDNSKPTDNNKV